MEGFTLGGKEPFINWDMVTIMILNNQSKLMPCRIKK